MTAKSLLHFICLLLLIYQLCIRPAYSADLDLGSGNRTHTAGNQPGTITVGGSTLTIAPGTMLTAAESVALSQVLGGGTQNLVLDAAGAASGGHFALEGASHGTVVIPAGVTAVHNFAESGGLALSGNLTNLGNFYAVSNSIQTMTAVINAQNINNSGLLTSVLPAGGLSGYSGLLSSLNLSLNAVQDIVNSGTISSSGNLNLLAGGAVVNALPQGMSGPNPIMQAMSNLNIVSSSVQNAGLITALNGNLNIASQMAQNLTVQNSGVMQALGNINVRDELFSAKFDTLLLGGDWISQQLNVFSGDGHINVDVNSISGQVNLIGGTAALAAQQGDLHVGALQMTGDPTISSGGDVFLEKSQFGGEWVFPGLDALIINAGGNIINVDVTMIGTTTGSGVTGAVIMTAGGMIDLQTNPITSISTATSNASSGGITLNADGPILLSGTLNTHSTNGQAGDISINSSSGNISTSGNFSIDSSSTGNNGGAVSLNSYSGISCQNGITVNTSSSNQISGNVDFVAQMGDIDLSGAAGKTNINASSGSGTAGQVNIQAMAGNLMMGDGTINLASSTGAGGAFSAFVNGGTVTVGKSLFDVSGKNGGSVSVVTTWMMADIDMSNVDIKANGSSGGTSGSVGLMAGLFGQGMVFSDKVAVNSIEVTGGDSSQSVIALSTSFGDVQAGSISSNGASVVITSAANVSVSSVVGDNASGVGGTLSVTSYAFAGPSDPTLPLSINAGAGTNSIGSVSVNGASGGSIYAFNHGTGSLIAGDLIVNASTGNGGNVILSSDSSVVLSGGTYSANAGTTGFGGQVSISGGTSVQGGDVSLSATGSTGGSISVTAPTVQFGNLNADTSSDGGIGFGGAISIGSTGTTLIADSMNLTNEGGGAGSVQLVGSLQVSNLTISSKGGAFPTRNGSNIHLVLADGILGNLNLDASGAESGTGGEITISTGGNLNLQSGQTSIVSHGGSTGGNGGQVFLFADGAMQVDSSTIDLTPQSANGNGGGITIDTGMNANSASGELTVNGTLNVDGVGNGNGGSVTITVRNTNTKASDLTIGNGSGFNISARSGSSSGNGGNVTVSVGGDLVVNGSGISVATQGISGKGGSIDLAAGVTGGNHTLSSSGNLNADGVGTGNGGVITMTAQQVSLTNGSLLSASAAGSGKGGTVTVSATGSNADLVLGSGSSVLATAATGAGGSIQLNASRDLSMSGATLDASSAGGAGGQLALNAGTSQTGSLSLDGNLLANAGGSASGGTISLTQNSALAMQIGKAGGMVGATLSASNLSGSGGTLNLSSGGSNDLNVTLSQAVNLKGSSLAQMGTINASSQGKVNVSGVGSLSGSFNGSADSYTVTVDGAGSNLGVKSVSATAGDATFKATAADSSLTFASGSSLQAATGSVEIGAPSMHFLGDSTISMDNAGLLKVNSGNQTSSLSMDFADASTVTFNVTQGAAVRPGLVQIGPNGTGSLSMVANNASLEFTGGTVSMNSAGGSVNLASGLSINSDAFDTTLNLGVEIIASNGDVNLNSSISARQLNVSTIGSGNINLAADVSSPTVVLSVQGNSSINQTGSGSLGIGTLIMSSQTGNIGSALNPIEANVFELQVTSGGSAFVNNASTVDLRTSTIAGTFQLNNEGDVAIESNLSAGNLNVSANGNISIFNLTSGNSGVVLASNGVGSNIQIASGVQLSSSAGSIDLSTDNLILDGSLLVQAAGAHVSVDSNGSLNLSGAGTITASGSNSLISLSGSNAVNFNSSYIMNAGSTGTVQVQTASLSSGGVNLAAGVNLNAAGGSQFNIFSNALSFGNGSSITGSNATNALTVQSTLGAALTISVAGGSTATVNATGGSVHFTAGTGGKLTFQKSGLGTGNLSVAGGQLITTSSAADTNLNNVNLVSNQNITVNVNGGTLNLDGNITSSQPGGVIVLQDPAGITINGTGTVGFTSGLSGTINVLAMAAGDSITFLGDTQFNAGSAGTVNFKSLGSVNFGAGANTTINNGATLNIAAPVLSFADGSSITATGASSINLSSIDASGLTVLLPNGSATISTSGSQINVSAESGAPVTFSQAASGSTSTLNFAGAPVTISTSNANVTIDESVVLHSDNNVSVLTPGGTLINNGLIENPNPGSTTIIEAAGDLFINDNVSANSLIIRTTANNGNITLSADVNVVNDLLVSAFGSGYIRQTAGILTAGSITLMSGSGNIGMEDERINVNTSMLSVNTAGSAHVQADGPVTVSSYNVGGGLDLKATGDITVGGGQTTVINSNGTFNAGSGGKVSILASDLISIASNVKIKVNDSTLDVSAASITMSDNSRLRSDGDLNVTGNVSGGDFKLVSREGNLQISGELSGHNVVLSTRDDGNISLNGNVSANHLTIDADGTGSISQGADTISAAKLTMRSDTGNIGSNALALNVSAAELSANTWGSGTVNLNATGNLDLSNSSAGGNFNVKSSGSLSVHNVETKSGSINLQANGLLRVEKGGRLEANQGNLTLQNNDTANGVISIGKNAELVALANTSGLGNINVVIGNVPASPVSGSRPANLSVNTKWGGHVYFGSNGITVDGKHNEVNAWGANVIFNTGSLGKLAIVLDGGVYMLADPPPAPVAVSLPAAAVLAPVATVSQIPSFNLPVVAGPSFVFGHALDTAAMLSRQSSSDNENNSQSTAVAQLDELTPIACVSTVTDAAVQQGVTKIVDLVQHSQLPSASVYTKSCHYDSEASRLSFKKGEMLVHARRFTQIGAGNSDVSLSGNSIALLKSTESGIEIFNVYEERWGAVKVTVSGREFVLGAGQCLVLGSGNNVAIHDKDAIHTSIAVRNERSEKLSAHSVRIGEFPLVSLISNSTLLADLIHSNEKLDRQLGARLLKMAACLQVVTATHGSFKN